MSKKIIPAVCGLIAFLIVWGVGGALVRGLPIPDAARGAAIIVLAIFIGIFVNNFVSKKI